MLTHIDEQNLPTMVDVTDKKITPRRARAQSLIQLPPEIQTYLKAEELYLKKGPVFQTAIIAGTMAAKKTHDLIPFCHQIPLESCKFKIDINTDLLVTITCEVKTTCKTGVEIEALLGASTAALTVYDMCKAISHNIVIRETRLLDKVGGKNTVLDRPLFGLVLTGGKSERMKSDKALLAYHGKPQAQHIWDILNKHCQEVYLSARKDQWKGTALESLPTLEDQEGIKGPIAGILSAFNKHPEALWLVVACDLVHFNEVTVQTLLTNYNADSVATAFQNSTKGFPEPLCTLYSPAAKDLFLKAVANDITCPVKVLKNSETHSIPQGNGVSLANINTIAEYKEVMHEIN